MILRGTVCFVQGGQERKEKQKRKAAETLIIKKCSKLSIVILDPFFNSKMFIEMEYGDKKLKTILQNHIDIIKMEKDYAPS
jgi:hypothetical protein